MVEESLCFYLFVLKVEDHTSSSNNFLPFEAVDLSIGLHQLLDDLTGGAWTNTADKNFAVSLLSRLRVNALSIEKLLASFYNGIYRLRKFKENESESSRKPCAWVDFDLDVFYCAKLFEMSSEGG